MTDISAAVTVSKWPNPPQTPSAAEAREIPLAASRFLLVALAMSVTACRTVPTRPVAAPWTADVGDGTYRNPVLNADWSDPDVIRVGDDFYLTASSFGRAPGLPLLHSRDLVNWTLVGHALQRLEPAASSRAAARLRGVGARAAAPRRPVLDLLGRPRPRHLPGQRRAIGGPGRARTWSRRARG